MFYYDQLSQNTESTVATYNIKNYKAYELKDQEKPKEEIVQDFFPVNHFLGSITKKQGTH
jgi:hypothetical protein